MRACDPITKIWYYGEVMSIWVSNPEWDGIAPGSEFIQEDVFFIYRKYP